MAGTTRRTDCTLTGEGCSWIEPLAPAKMYPAGYELFRQGSIANDVYLIDRGLVKLIHSRQNGTITTVALRHPGYALGASAALLGKPQPVTAATLTLSYLRCVQAAELRRLINEDATCSWQLHLVQSHELYTYTTELTERGALSARRRLGRLLLELLVVHQQSESRKKIRLKLPLNYNEIAELVGVTREHLSQILKQMQREGIIEPARGGIVISDLVKLGDFLDIAPADLPRAG